MSLAKSFTLLALAGVLSGAYPDRGRAYTSRGQNELALTDFDQAIHLDPNLVKARGAASSGGSTWLQCKVVDERTFMIVGHDTDTRKPVEEDETYQFNSRANTLVMMGVDGGVLEIYSTTVTPGLIKGWIDTQSQVGFTNINPRLTDSVVINRETLSLSRTRTLLPLYPNLTGAITETDDYHGVCRLSPPPVFTPKF